MQELRDLARRLLQDHSVDVVVGYEEGPLGVRPAFITDATLADRLVFDTRAVHNLASYLSPRRKHLARFRKKALVVKGCDVRAVAGLLRENQVKRDELVLIGVRCGGVALTAVGKPEPLTAVTVAPRCAGCQVREPKLVDYVLGELPSSPPARCDRDERIAALDALSAEERLAFWQHELERCVRCHACREVCPMCFCERCIADQTEPRWIESSPHLRGNFAWQFTRVLHQAGRCVDCGECERACPAHIPLGLLVRKVAKVVEERFDYRTSDDPAVASPIGAYRIDEEQELFR